MSRGRQNRRLGRQSRGRAARCKSAQSNTLARGPSMSFDGETRSTTITLRLPPDQGSRRRRRTRSMRRSTLSRLVAIASQARTFLVHLQLRHFVTKFGGAPRAPYQEWRFTMRKQAYFGRRPQVWTILGVPASVVWSAARSYNSRMIWSISSRVARPSSSTGPAMFSIVSALISLASP